MRRSCARHPRITIYHPIMDKTVPSGRVKGTLTPPLLEKLRTARLGGIASLRRDLRAAQHRVLQRHALGAAVHRDARRPRDPDRRRDAFDRRRTAPAGAHAPRRRVGSFDTPFHPHRFALRHADHHRRRGHAAPPPHGDDDRTAAHAGRPGARQRRIPALRSPRTDPRRRGRRGRLGLVAVHHGTHAGAAAGPTRHHDPCAERGFDPLSGHDHRHRGPFRRGNLP